MLSLVIRDKIYHLVQVKIGQHKDAESVAATLA